MRILTIADVESKYLWDYFDKEKVKGIDLIISCGDLKAEYLSFLATMVPVPVLYVHGNHDKHYQKKPPEGCICIDDRIYVHNGVRILGLGGSIRYNEENTYRYTEQQMKKRVRRLIPRLLWYRGFDILVTHAPAAGLNDGPDFPHTGFQVFDTLMDKYEPKYFLHGHVHLNYGAAMKRLDSYNRTKVINAYEKYVFDYEE